MMQTPTWVLCLVERVCRDAGREVIPINWLSSEEILGSGQAFSDFLQIHAAQRDIVYWDIAPDTYPARLNGRTHTVSARNDQRLVLLHELAHYLTPGHHHDEVFWHRAWTLFRQYKVPIRYAAWRENHYINPEAAYTAQMETLKEVVG